MSLLHCISGNKHDWYGMITAGFGGRLTWGPTLLVAGEEFQPHVVVVRESDQGQNFILEGPMIELLNLLASHINFT